MKERIKALSVLALSGGLDPMDCQETKKSLGKHTGGNHAFKQQCDFTWGWWVDCGTFLVVQRRKMALQKEG